MKKKDFDELVTSIRQAGLIRHGEADPGRVTEVTPVDVKAIRLRLGKSQAEFARGGLSPGKYNTTGPSRMTVTRGVVLPWR